MMRQMRPPEPVMTGEQADLPLLFVRGMPVVSVMVNGRGPFKMGIDTGAAGYLRLSPALAQSLQLQQVGEVLAGDPSGRNPVRIPVYNVEKLSLGDLTYKAVSTTALSERGPSSAEVDGIIGLGFFEHLLLTIDYGRSRVTAQAGQLPPANGADIVNLSYDRSLVSLPIRVGEQIFDVHLDTGNTAQPLFLPEDIAATLPTRGGTRSVGRARTVSQEMDIRARDLAVPVSVGTTLLPVSTVAFPSVAPPGNIGSLALQGMALTLDYANRRVRIVPSQR
jgi:predicted aspartyl protease